MMADVETGRVPTLWNGVALFIAALVLHLSLGWIVPMVRLGESALLVAAPVMLIIVTLAAVKITGVDPVRTLALRLPKVGDLLMTLPLAASFFIVNEQLALLVGTVVEIPDAIEDAMVRMLRADDLASWALKIGTVCVGAAVSEELLFRGYIQSAFLSRSRRKLPAVAWTAALFMMLHLLPLPTYWAAGLVLSLVTLASGSLLVPIVVHFLNNLMALVLVNTTNVDALEEVVWIPPVLLVPAIAVFTVTALFYIGRVPSDALADVSANRRRVGWLIVGTSLMVGIAVFGSLVATSAYLMRPQRAHASAIRTLKEMSESRLAPDARARAEDLASAFDALSAANQSGQLRGTSILEVGLSLARLAEDGALSAREVDTLVDQIHEIVMGSTMPRRM